MLDPTPAELDRLRGPGNRPYYILDIYLDEQMHVATGGDAMWGDIEYTKGHVKDLRVSPLVASFSVDNSGSQHTAPALMGLYHRKPIKVWSAPQNKIKVPMLIDPGYVEDGYFEEPIPITPMLIFSGHITEISSVNELLKVVATRSGGKGVSSRIVPPLANWTAPRDKVINFNGAIVRLISRL